MIAITASGIGRFQSNCHENLGMARDDEDNRKRVMVAIAILRVSRGIVTRIWDCQGDVRVSVHHFGKPLRWEETRKIIGEMMTHKQPRPGGV